ncbi:MAG TPA: c-type cytochrome [Gemmatimonadaceae bacterium]|jgi:mono/diheme cytochrome c family protein|nr:c-type cytochrome [Gemmatimonadaceae bacterium]
MIRKILLVLGSVLLVVVVGGALYVGSRQHLTFDAPYPKVVASKDSAVIDRGRYIVRVAAGCAACHGDPAQRAAYKSGADTPLIGGFVFDIPPGKFYPRNLTPDAETGLGGVGDSAIARALRYGVGHDGRALLPFMEMQGLSDDDLVAVVSYLRTQAPVHNVVPPHYFNVMGKVVKATAMSRPVGPSSTPPAVAPRGASVETGKYLVESVALCWACHTERSRVTGALTGPKFGGTKGFQEADDPTHSWSPPNITSDKETGRLGLWTEDQFVARFRQGRVIPGSPMPWQAFAKLSEDDLRSIYRYLKSVPAVKRDNGPVMVTEGKKS